MEGRTQRQHIHGYLNVRCFILVKGLSYVFSHACVMERVTVDEEILPVVLLLIALRCPI